LSNDQRLVTGFWADIDTRGSITNGTDNKVYYQIHSDTSLNNVTSSVLNKASGYVRSFFPQQRPFVPTMVIVGTWYRVGAYPAKTDRLNTFQIALATDGDRSFTFLLYHDLQWAGPQYTSEPYAQAGFNAGDGIAFEMLPHSRTAAIVRLVNETNVNVPGLFAFRVDTDEIDAGGCSSNVSSAGFRPRTSSQLGTTALTIQGPCFSTQITPKCRFGSTSTQLVDAIIIDSFRALCLSPFASVHGPVPVSISVDDGLTYITAGTLTYAPLRFGSDEVIIETESVGNLLKEGEFITLRWRFLDSIRDILPNGTSIDIELRAINMNAQSELRREDVRVLLAQNIDLNQSSHRLQLPATVQSIATCYIRVVAKYQSKIYAGLNTGLLVVQTTPSFATETCTTWSNQQPEPSTWNMAGLLPCPMTRTQAISAGRCCYEADSECYLNNPMSNNCWLHQGRSELQEESAVECYRSKSYNIFNASAECCYDRQGQLITRGTGAGTDDRHHPVTFAVKHFFDDRLPFLQCCMMSLNVELCDTYMRLRPPRRGSNTMGETGGTWGDPHLTTLDGTSYTFNGHGEYVYLAISVDESPSATFDWPTQSFVFMSQIRTAPLSSNDATVTKGFAARSNDPESQPISVTISRRDQLLLYRGNTSFEFDDHIDTLVYPEMTIERLGNDMRKLILSWNLGVTVQISLVDLTTPSRTVVMNIGVSVAGLYRTRTYGLLGTYDGQSSNDLRTPDGSFVSSNSSLEVIHQQFGTKWAIIPSKSLFRYESDQSAVMFQQMNQHFIPSFKTPNVTTTQDLSIRHTCGIGDTVPSSSWTVAQRSCYYDVSVTNDTDFGQSSLAASNEILTIKTNQRNPPQFDTSLPISMDVKTSDQIELKINVTSEYSSNVIELTALHLPIGGKFDSRTKTFSWKAGENDDYVRIQATDKTYNLTATHEILFKIIGNTSSALKHDFFFVMVLFTTIFTHFYF